MVDEIIDKAKALGFIAIGFSKPEKPLFFDLFTKWLSRQKHGDMTWLERNREVRADPSKLLKGSQSIISLAFPFPSHIDGTSDGLKVSRYSQPNKEDYHFWLKQHCRDLTDLIEDKYHNSNTKVCVDSVPILERSFAYASGMGFIGKNNMLIIPGHGSFLYLAEIITTAPLKWFPAQPMKNHCGSCTSCIDACPTNALEAPYCLDASRCLSYLTIEYKGRIDRETRGKMGRCFFGCDICQEVCPHNREASRVQVSLPSAEGFMNMNDTLFQKKYGRTTFARAGLEKLKTNIRAVKGGP